MNTEEDLREKAMKDALEASPLFQANLHVANAINFKTLGYSVKEAVDFLL